VKVPACYSSYRGVMLSVPLDAGCAVMCQALLSVFTVPPLGKLTPFRKVTTLLHSEAICILTSNKRLREIDAIRSVWPEPETW